MMFLGIVRVDLQKIYENWVKILPSRVKIHPSDNGQRLVYQVKIKK